MADMMVQIKVKDYSEWHKLFLEYSDMRLSHGELSHKIYQDAGDANKVTILYQWDSLAKAQAFSQSAELKAAQAKAGVLGPPSFTFLKEA